MCVFHNFYKFWVLVSCSFLIMYSTYEIVHNLCLSVPNSFWGIFYVDWVGVGIFVEKMLVASFACKLNKKFGK